MEQILDSSCYTARRSEVEQEIKDRHLELEAAVARWRDNETGDGEGEDLFWPPS